MSKNVRVCIALFIILFFNVSAYVIYSVFARRLDAYELIFLSALIPFLIVIFTQTQTRSGQRENYFLVCIRQEIPEIQFDATWAGIFSSGYMIFFWVGFTTIDGSTALVLSLLSLAIVTTPYFCRNKNGYSPEYMNSLWIVVGCLITASFFFSIKRNFDEGLFSREALEIGLLSLIQLPVILILLAVLCESLKDYFLDNINHSVSSLSFHPDIDEDGKKDIAMDIAFGIGMIIFFAISLTIFLTFVAVLGSDFGANIANKTEEKANLSAYLFGSVFVFMGIFIRLKGEAYVKAAKFKFEAFAALFALRPLLFAIIGPSLGILFAYLQCDKTCDYGYIQIDSFFQQYKDSDTIGIIAICLGAVLVIKLFNEEDWFYK